MEVQVGGSDSSADGPSLRPRVMDVSEEPYAAIQTLVDSTEEAYFKRKSGETVLIIP